jgi:hypothetical protein
VQLKEEGLVAKPAKKKSARSKKTAQASKRKAGKKSRGQAKVKARPAAPRAPMARTSDVTSDPQAVFACTLNQSGQPVYEGLPEGLWQLVEEIPEFGAVIPRGQITISVKPHQGS